MRRSKLLGIADFIQQGRRAFFLAGSSVKAAAPLMK